MGALPLASNTMDFSNGLVDDKITIFHAPFKVQWRDDYEDITAGTF